MKIEKRTLPMYIFLNIITLGIYGFVVSSKIEKEVNALCKGDGEAPQFGYFAAVALRGIAPLLGIIVGLILALVGIDSIFSQFGFAGAFFARLIPDSSKVIAVFLMMTLCGILFSIGGSVISGIYLNFWWYRQANRLKLNTNRYGIEIKEKGSDMLLFRTAMNILFLPITLIAFVLAITIPAIIVWLISLAESTGAFVFMSILIFIFSLPLMFFGSELTTGAHFAAFFMFKNLNRYADVYRNGATPFDPMAYEYYPSINAKYPNFVPGMINGGGIASASADEIGGTDGEVSTGVLGAVGNLIGINGSCAGYNFELTSGEEIIIGKDAKVSMVVIDPAYKEISRKHVGVCYDVIRDQYRVVDYSSNGTWANGSKLVTGQEVYLPHGTELKLANGKNTFRLG